MSLGDGFFCSIGCRDIWHHEHPDSDHGARGWPEAWEVASDAASNSDADRVAVSDVGDGVLINTKTAPGLGDDIFPGLDIDAALTLWNTRLMDPNTVKTWCGHPILPIVAPASHEWHQPRNQLQQHPPSHQLQQHQPCHQLHQPCHQLQQPCHLLSQLNLQSKGTSLMSRAIQNCSEREHL